jgi:hypothetical protein
MMNKDRFVEYFVTSFLVNWKNKLPPGVWMEDGTESTTRKLAETIAETIYETVRVIR